MTSEERLDRLERVAKLLVRAGFRARRELNEKVNIIINAQIKTEERLNKLVESQTHTDEQLRALLKSQQELAESQKLTDARLNTLIDIVRRDRNGDST